MKVIILALKNARAMEYNFKLCVIYYTHLYNFLELNEIPLAFICMYISRNVVFVQRFDLAVGCIKSHIKLPFPWQHQLGGLVYNCSQMKLKWQVLVKHITVAVTVTVAYCC